VSQRDNMQQESGSTGKHRASTSTMWRTLALLAILTPIWSCSSPTAPTTAVATAAPTAAPPAAPAGPTPTAPNAACVQSNPSFVMAEDVDTVAESEADGINIVFNALTLTPTVGDAPSTDPDRLLFLDVDFSRTQGFAIEQGPGSGWTTVSDTFPTARIADGVDAASGSYTLRVERVGAVGAGDQYDVAMTVTVAPSADGLSMEVSGLEACPVVVDPVV
jgi:hypothetical protein